MIQDIFPHQLFNQYDPTAHPLPEEPVLHFDGGKVLLHNDTGSFPSIRDYPDGTGFTYLFSLDDIRFFFPVQPATEPEGFSFIDTMSLRRSSSLPRHVIFAVLTGKHLSDWYRDNRFCGRCGCTMGHSPNERAMVCPSCKNTVYPRIMPAVIVGVKNGDRLLLTKYRTGYGHNALIAGFTEIGETLEQTVAREVMEEAGVKVKNIRYYKSQPWGIANDILAGFYCDVDGYDEIHMDQEELKYAQWVPRNEIQLQPDDFSLTNEMMMRFQNGEE